MTEYANVNLFLGFLAQMRTYCSFYFYIVRLKKFQETAVVALSMVSDQ
jgi:hypothetical protein